MSVDPVSLAITVALDAASMALAASKKIEGPRVADLSATVADYGTPLNYIYGVRRIEGACFYCEPMIEKKHHTKGKGGKYTEYRYFGTFAIIVADHGIVRYSRIWFDRHLVYSVVGGGQVEDPTDHSTLSQFMRQYLGTSTQPADPRMVAYITSKEGANRTPAYLDIAYLMFEALPLEFLGNRFPQVSAEVDGGGAGNAVIPGTPFTFTVEGSATLFTDSMTEKNLGPFNFSIEVVAHDDLGNSDILDLNGQSNDPIITGSYGVDSWTTGDTVSYAVGDVTVAVTWYGDGGSRRAGSFDVEVTSERPLTFDPFIADTSGMTAGWVDPSAFGGGWPGVFPGDWDPLPAINGNLLTSNAFYLTNYAEFPGPSWQKDFDINGPPAPTVVTLGAICSDVARRAGMAAGDYDFTALDQVIAGFSWTIAQGKQIVAPLLDIYDSDIFCHNFQLSGRKRGSATTDGPEIDAAYLVREQRQQASSTSGPLYHILMEAESDLPRRVFASYADTTGDQQPNTAVAQRNIAATVTTREVPIDMTNLALTPDDAQPLVERWLRRQWMGATTFTHTIAPGEIAIECADLRNSNLNGQVLAGRLTRMVLRADRSIQTEWQLDGAVSVIPEGILVLQVEAYSTVPFTEPNPNQYLQISVDVSALDIDNTLITQVSNFPVDSNDPPNPISLWPAFEDSSWYAIRDDSANVYDFFTEASWLDSGQPYRLSVTAVSNDALLGRQDYDPAVNNMAFRWRTAVVASLASPEAAVVLSAGPWTNIGSELVEQDVTWRFSIDGSGTDFNGSILDTGSDMGVGNVSRLIDSPGAPQLGRPPDTIFSPQLARAFVLDIPLVSDADDQTTPFIYLTAGRLVQGGTFPGAEIQQSDTDLDDWVAGWDSISSTAEAVWGVCENALGDALPWIPDRGNVLVVNMPNGSLDSQADEYLNANPAVNLAAIGTHAGGWEIVQFGEAVVQSEGIWQTSNFYRRGVRGTESFIPDHVAGELFILLQSLTVHDLGAGEIGDTDYYRAVTNTTNADEAEEVSVDYSAQAHRPLSPVNVVLTRNAGSGDWHGEFVRRTRVGGGTLNGQDVPLGEASEAYRVKVMNGVTVVRTINVTSPEFDYLNATQVTDWGSPQVNLTVAVCQMNPTLSIEGAATTASA